MELSAPSDSTAGAPGAAATRPGALPVLMPPQARQFLMRSLLESGDFIVLERERILQLVGEIELGRGPYVAPETTPRMGRLIGVHYIIEAACLPPGMGGDDAARAEYSQRASLFSSGELPRGQHAVFLDVYHVETGRVVGVAFGAHQSLTLATRIAVDDLRQRLVNEAPPVKVMSLQKREDKLLAVLDIGSEDRINLGDRFAVQRSDAASAVIEAVEVHALYCVGHVLSGDKDVRERDVVTRLKS